MAEMGWTARVAAAAGIAAGTGAAQLGLGYGLGVVVWPVTDTADDGVWLGSLGWATWITASATVFGAVLASRLAGGPPGRLPASPRRLTGPWRLALSASAAIGALVAVALIALPARAAVRGDTFSPQVIAAGYALLGVLLGLVVAYWAVVSRPVAANLITTGVWLWALAISAVVVDLTLHRSSATYLTSWQFAGGAGHLYGTIFWPSALLTLAAAFVIGIGAVLPAARRGRHGTGAATSGAVGPLLVAAAFFALAPQLTGAPGPLESAYLIAPYAVLAGLAGSAIAVASARAVAARRARPLAATPRSDPTQARNPILYADPEPTPNQTPAAAPEQPRSNVSTRTRVTAADPGEPEQATEPREPAGATKARDRARATKPRNRARGTEPGEPAPATAPGDPSPATSPGEPSGTTPPGEPSQVTTLGEPSRTTPTGKLSQVTTLGEPSRTTSPGERSDSTTPGGPAHTTSPGLDAIPAADPATFPAPTEPKRKGFWGRRQPKLPTQAAADEPRPASSQTGETPRAAASSQTGGTPRASASSVPEQAARSAGAPVKPAATPATPTRPEATPSGLNPRSPAATPPSPSARPAPQSAQPAQGGPNTQGGPLTQAGPTTQDGTKPTKSVPIASSPPLPSSPPTKTTPSPVKATGPAPTPAAERPAPNLAGQRSAPTPASELPAPPPAGERPELIDPEIAEAARPRGRAKKAAAPAKPPRDDKSPQSTITPPPANPTIAQINPTPPAD